MVRRSFDRGELLLVVLTVLEGRPMSEGEIFAELDGLLGLEYRVTRSGVRTALDALEAEGLVEVAAARRVDAYRVTREGVEAVCRRADAAVLERAERALRSGPTPARSVSHEVQQVAILFTDVVGSTELLDRLGDDAAHDLRRRHFALLRRIVRDQGGHEVKSLGDGLMIAFRSARAAVTCALAMQRAVDADEDPLELRIGIASGETVREDGDYFGRPVIVARRLCDAARAGDVLVSEATRRLVPGFGRHEFEPVGPLTLKGLSAPVAASSMRLRPPALSV
jgi:class 3 adenylate cyclase